MRRFFAIALFALTSSAGLAQTASNGEIARTEDSALLAQGQPASSAIMPLWSTPDGRILALAAMVSNNTPPALTPSPLVGSVVDWRLIDITDYVVGGVSLRLANNVNAYASFDHGVILTPLLAPASSLGCGAAFGGLALDNRCSSSMALANSGAVNLGTGVNSGNLQLDLSYGLSWLRLNEQSRTNAQLDKSWDFFATIDNHNLPTLVIPGIELANIQNSAVSASGRWHFDENQSLDLSAALGRIQFDLPGNSALMPNLNQAALSFGMHRGDFSGVIVGRMLGPNDLLGSGQRWSTIDLGISWRAPWRGVFSVGAQNLWSSGNPASLTDPTARETDPSQARVPYVQYHQDL